MTQAATEPMPVMATLFLRGVDPDVARRMKTSARARGKALGPYFESLFRLHEAVRSRADNGDASLQELLGELGLESVRV